MEPESHTSDSGTADRLTRAQSSVVASATQIRNSLGNILELAGSPMTANQPFWRRLDVFARADLGRVLRADAQADIARYLSPLVSLHDRLADARWEILPPAGPDAPEALAGHASGSTVTTTIEAIELLAQVFAGLAETLESLATRLTARTLLDAPIPSSLRAYTREISDLTGRVSTLPDPVWQWDARLDADH